MPGKMKNRNSTTRTARYPFRRTRRPIAGDLEAELLGERLAQQPHAHHEPFGVASALDRRAPDGVANASRACIGDEPFGAGAGGDEQIGSAVTRSVTWLQQQYDAGIARRVAGAAARAYAPLAPDVARH